jgi:hypothetical protein
LQAIAPFQSQRLIAAKFIKTIFLEWLATPIARGCEQGYWGAFQRSDGKNKFAWIQPIAGDRERMRKFRASGNVKPSSH